jgi:CHAD domain-containing protein
MAGDPELAQTGAATKQDQREIEWQLAARDLGLVRQWLNDHSAFGAYTIEPRPTRTIYDTYLDTDDWRFHRAGFALRLRDVPGQAEATLKDLAPGTDGLRVRREINEALPAAEQTSLASSHGPVSARVHAVAGTQPLRTLFRVRTQRQPFAVMKDEGQQAAEIALDETIVASADGGARARIKRVDVEALSELPQSLEGLVDQLRVECELEAAADSKYEVGLKSAGLTAPVSTDLGSLLIEPTLSIAEVARANLRRHLWTWLTCEPAARLGEDVEQLHELRVAARRLDASLGLFEEHLPKSITRTRPAWKALVRTLGTVRDLDVQLGELDRFAAELNEIDRQRLAPLRSRLDTERQNARTRMLSVLDRESTRRLVERLRAALFKPSRMAVRRNNPKAALVAPRLILRTFKKLRRAAKEADKHMTAAAYHDVRRRTKRLRYAIESFEGFYGESAVELLQTVRRLQNRLGSHQDANVAADRFRAMVGTRSWKMPGETVFLMGVFTERQRLTASDMRQRFTKSYRRVRGRRWKAFRRAMAELESTHGGGTAQAAPAPSPL